MELNYFVIIYRFFSFDGKSSGVDGISAEHFVFAHSRIHVLLSLLFSAFIKKIIKQLLHMVTCQICS